MSKEEVESALKVIDASFISIFFIYLYSALVIMAEQHWRFTIPENPTLLDYASFIVLTVMILYAWHVVRGMVIQLSHDSGAAEGPQ
jgi:hypothetical protein